MLKRLLRALALLLAAVALAVALLPQLVETDSGRAVVLGLLGRVAGLRLSASRLRLGYDLRILCHDLEVSTRSGIALLTAREVEVELPPARLARGRVGAVRIEGFSADITEYVGSGRGTGAARDWRDPPFDLLALRDGHLHWGSQEGLRVYVVDVEARAAAALGIPSRNPLPSLSTDLLADAGAVQPAASAVALRVDLRVEGGPFEHPAELTGSVALAADGAGASVDCAVALVPGVSVATLRGTVAVTDERGRQPLDLTVVWSDVALAVLAEALFDEAGQSRGGGALHLEARVYGDAASPQVAATLRLDDVQAQLGALSLAGSAMVPLHYDGKRLSSSAATLSDLRLAYAGAEAVVPRLSAAASFELGDGRRAVELSDVVATGIAAHDAEFRRIVEGLAVAGSLRLSSGESGPRASLALAAAVGELLWDRFYLDLAGTAVRVSAQAVISTTATHVTDALLELAGVGQVRGRADVGAAGSLRSATISLDLDDIERAFELFVRAPLEASHPVVSRIRVGGSLGATVAVHMAGQRLAALDGHLSMKGGRLALEGGRTRLAGLEAEIPLRIGRAGADAARQRGSVRVGSARVGGIAVPGFELALSVGRDRIEVPEDLYLSVAGGEVRVGSLGLYALSTAERRLRLGLSARDLDAAAVFGALGWPRFAGSISADFKRIEASRSRIVTEGEAHAAMFGGEMSARGLRLEQLDSPVPSLFVDLEAHGIDLSLLTAATSLGDISGMAAGAVENLEIVDGQPVRFDAWLQTVSGHRRSQRISVTALEQLQILGGAGANPLTSGLLGFFDSYRYAKMGVRCQLRNDRFVLEGVESADGKDFLVVGSLLPPTVNVISHNQVIDFSQMVRRLSRIAAAGAGADAAGSGEVVR